MDSISRRTIEELEIRYQLEPELRDLYVEGPRDKRLFDWFFRKIDYDSIAVFEINSIEIEYSLIQKYALHDNNRDRVIALSFELERILSDKNQYLSCVADSDFDFILGRKYDSCYLIFTDYTSLDLYLWSEETFEKFFNLIAPSFSVNIASLLTNFTKILQDLFLIRATNEKLNWGLSWVDFTRCCEIKNNFIIFDHDEFCRRYLTASGKIIDLTNFIKEYEKLKKIKARSPLQLIRGGDFLELIGWYVSKVFGRKGNLFRKPEVIRAVLTPALNIEELKKEKLFKKLVNKYKS